MGGENEILLTAVPALYSIVTRLNYCDVNLIKIKIDLLIYLPDTTHGICSRRRSLTQCRLKGEKKNKLIKPYLFFIDNDLTRTKHPETGKKIYRLVQLPFHPHHYFNCKKVKQFNRM